MHTVHALLLRVRSSHDVKCQATLTRSRCTNWTSTTSVGSLQHKLTCGAFLERLRSRCRSVLADCELCVADDKGQFFVLYIGGLEVHACRMLPTTSHTSRRSVAARDALIACFRPSAYLAPCFRQQKEAVRTPDRVTTPSGCAPGRDVLYEAPEQQVGCDDNFSGLCQ